MDYDVHRSDPRWLELYDRIEQQVALERSQVDLGGQIVDWYRVADPEELLTAAVEDSVGRSTGSSAAEIDPFWAATWRAARGLDRFLASRVMDEHRVLELGCGSGQAGVGAALRGAQVTLTDSVPLALDVARLNAFPVWERVEFRQLNWGESRLAVQKFPLVIGSDLVFDPALFEDLERSARNHLAGGGRLFLSEPHRHTGDKFGVFIRQRGWDVVEHDVDLEDGRVAVRVFECSLPAAH